MKRLTLNDICAGKHNNRNALHNPMDFYIDGGLYSVACNGIWMFAKHTAVVDHESGMQVNELLREKWRKGADTLQTILTLPAESRFRIADYQALKEWAGPNKLELCEKYKDCDALNEACDCLDRLKGYHHELTEPYKAGYLGNALVNLQLVAALIDVLDGIVSENIETICISTADTYRESGEPIYFDADPHRIVLMPLRRYRGGSDPQEFKGWLSS